MKLTVIDETTGERESSNINFKGRFSGHLPQECIGLCFHNGIKVDPRDLTVEDDSNVVLYVRPAGGGVVVAAVFGGAFASSIAGSIMAAVLSFVISSIASLAISTIFRKKPKKPKLRQVRASRQQESPTYAFEGISDTIAPGAPIPFVLGKARKGGQIISSRVELIDNGKKQKLFMLFAMGYGEANNIYDEELNGSAMSNFKNVTSDWRPGTSGQSVIPDFETVDQTYFDGREFTTGSIIYNTKGDVERVDLFIGSLQGLFHNDDQGGFHTNNSTYKVEYRVTGGGGWTLDKQDTVTGRTTNAKFKIHTLTLPAKDTYDIQFTWISATHTDQSKDQWKLSLHNVVERIFETRTYPGQVLLGIKAITTAELNGQMPNVTAIFEAKVNVVGTGLTFTENNGWCIRYCIEDDRWGLGHRIPASWIDEPSWLAFADYCDDQVEKFGGGTENRHKMSYVGDVKRKGWDLINDLLAMCDASVVFTQGKLKVVIDKAKTASQLYGAANTVPGSLSISYGRAERRVNTINGKFFNDEDGYKSDFVRAKDTDALLTESTKVDDISLIGVSRQSEAIRAVERQLRENVLRFKEYAWNAPMEALIAEPGDIVKKQYFVADYERGYSGYILDKVAADEVILDRTVNLKSGKTYEMFVRHKDTNVFEQIDITNASGDWGRIKLNTALTQAASEGDLYGIGEKTVGIKDVILTDVTQQSDGTFKLSGENYDPDVYTPKSLPTKQVRKRMQVGDVPPLPIENFTVRENIDTLPDGSIDTRLEFDIIPGMLVNPGKALGATASTIDLSIDEPEREDFFLNAEIHVIGGTGAGQSRKALSYDGLLRRVDQLDSNWSTTPDTTSLYQAIFAKAGEYYGVFVEISEDAVEWTELGSFIGTEGSLPIRGQGNEIHIRLIPFTITGKKNENALLSVTMTVSGKDVEPSDITNFSVVQIADRLLFTYDGVTDSDLSHYEIREGTNWEQSALVATGIRTIYHETTNFVEGAKNYLIKAVDNTGNESVTEAVFAITLTVPNNRQTYLTFDELVSLGGVFDGLSIRDLGGGQNGIGLDALKKWDAGENWDAGMFWDDNTSLQTLTGTYETETQTIGVISMARIAADIGFLDSTGSTLIIEEKHSDDGSAWTPWRIIGAGDQKWKFAKLRITLSAATFLNDPIINKFNVIIDALVRAYRGINVSVPAAGKTEVFPVKYINTPGITVTPVGTAATKARIESQDNSEFTMKLFDDADNAVLANANWTAEGI